MATRNDITGDLIASKQSTDAYRDGWDAIFAVCKNCGERKSPTHECSQAQQAAKSAWRKRMIDPGYSGAIKGEQDDT